MNKQRSHFQKRIEVENWLNYYTKQRERIDRKIEKLKKERDELG